MKVPQDDGIWLCDSTWLKTRSFICCLRSRLASRFTYTLCFISIDSRAHQMYKMHAHSSAYWYHTQDLLMSVFRMRAWIWSIKAKCAGDFLKHMFYLINVLISFASINMLFYQLALCEGGHLKDLSRFHCEFCTMSIHFSRQIWW